MAVCRVETLSRWEEKWDAHVWSVWVSLFSVMEYMSDCVVRCQTWNPSPFDPPALVHTHRCVILTHTHVQWIWEQAVAAGNRVSLYELHPKLIKWQKVLELEEHKEDVRDIAWVCASLSSLSLTQTHS